MKKNKAVTILEALLEGHRIKIEDSEYILCDGNELCLVAQKFSRGVREPEEAYLKTDMSLASFVSWSQKISDADQFLLGAQRVMTMMNRKER